jgi:hypothetical protein
VNTIYRLPEDLNGLGLNLKKINALFLNCPNLENQTVLSFQELIGKLKNLEILSLRNTKMKNIPSESFTNANYLKWLDLQNNRELITIGENVVSPTDNEIFILTQGCPLSPKSRHNLTTITTKPSFKKKLCAKTLNAMIKFYSDHQSLLLCIASFCCSQGVTAMSATHLLLGAVPVKVIFITASTAFYQLMQYTGSINLLLGKIPKEFLEEHTPIHIHY